VAQRAHSGFSGGAKFRAGLIQPDIVWTFKIEPRDRKSACYWQKIMIRKLKSGSYRLYSRKKNPKIGKRRNLGTFKTRAAAKKHEKAVQYFKRR
jgi:hypothetical protein